MKMNDWLWLLKKSNYAQKFHQKTYSSGSNAAKISFIYKKKSKVKVGKIIQEIEEGKMKK
jgi:hypothetical protein